MTDPFARYWQAVTHRSHTEGLEGEEHYERLEFLGDAVLQLAVSELLVEAFPDAAPGALTKRRQRLVDNATLAEISREIGLPSLARFGKGERRAKGTARESEKVQADLLEAVLGAIHEEEGWAVARAVVRYRWAARVRRSRTREVNPKVALQERIQRRHGVVPTYRTVSETGPPHARTFLVAVEVKGEELGRAPGSSKKDAQRAAAVVALRSLGSRRSVDP